MLLNWAQVDTPLSNGETRLNAEIDWLKKARVCYVLLLSLPLSLPLSHCYLSSVKIN